jgi:hypothetical protein
VVAVPGTPKAVGSFFTFLDSNNIHSLTTYANNLVGRVALTIWVFID